MDLGRDQPEFCRTRRGRGRVQMQDLQFTTRVSKAGPKLFLACAAGERLPKRCSPRERPEATGWSSLPTRSRTCS